jgi:hypothetical protein
MSRRDRAGRIAGICVVALLAAAGTRAAPRALAATADASALYNAGTAALDRGDLGRAVAFLRAAERVDPRAPDLRRNLAEAQARSAAVRGAEPPAAAVSFPLTAPESWWLAAGLVLLGAVLSAAARRAPRAASLAAHAILLAGTLSLAWLGLRSREEAIHPAAVVIAPSLPAGPAPDERSRPPYLLQAGEEVRLGRARGALVEIRVAGTPIGWAERSGVWRVADAARYTGDLPRP